MTGNPVEIRNPDSTRPWQHVLDPLVGYLYLIEELHSGRLITSLNFGPKDIDVSVKDITNIAIATFPKLEKIMNWKSKDVENMEANRLQISSSRTSSLLNWEPKWTPIESVGMTFKWWKDYLSFQTNVGDLCRRDINEYFSKNEKIK
jgi:CDP-glucose 4,6-dehydratase